MRKHLRKMVALVAAMVMVLAMGVTAFADAPQTTKDGTITVTNAAAGATYQAYKILDATYDGTAIAYTTTNPTVIGATGSPFTVSATADTNGNYAVTVADGTTAATIAAWVKDNLTNFTAINASSGVDATGKANADEVEFTGLAYGYYYITSSVGSVVTVDSVAKDVEVIDKNDNDFTTPVKTNDQTTAQVGDTVNFTTTFTAKNYVTKDSTTEKVTVYNVTDTPNGYDINVSTLKVTVGTTDITAQITDEAVDSTTGVLSFTIPWVDANGDLLYADESTVTITYSGTINASAADGQAENSISVSKNDDETGKTDTSTTTTYNLTINKVDENQDPLTGAKFEVYRNDATDALSLVKLDAPADGSTAATGTVYYRVAYTGETGTTTIDMSEASSAVIYGLDGTETYKVKEIQAPAGYNIKTGTTDATLSNNNGTATVTNNKGTELPSTGGAGTVAFTIIGAALVLGAGVALVTRKRIQQ